MAQDVGQFPWVEEALLLWLERAFPDRCPVPGMSVEEIWMAAGAARAVRKLRQVYERQSETALRAGA